MTESQASTLIKIVGMLAEEVSLLRKMMQTLAEADAILAAEISKE